MDGRLIVCLSPLQISVSLQKRNKKDAKAWQSKVTLFHLLPIWEVSFIYMNWQFWTKKSFSIWCTFLWLIEMFVTVSTCLDSCFLFFISSFHSSPLNWQQWFCGCEVCHARVFPLDSDVNGLSPASKQNKTLSILGLP